jgi:molybdate transport system substrate-binding protein
MRLILLTLFVFTGLFSGTVYARDIVVFAAASTIQVMTDIRNSRNEAGPDTIRIVYGSSGALARQIETGAPADVYFSANEKWVDYLAGRKLARGETRKTVFSNRIVLITSAGNQTPAPFNPTTDFGPSLGRDGRLAIGNPQHVPAGIYARQAMTSLGLWSQFSHRTAQTQNVRLALALVQRGEAVLGIVYYTDAIQSSHVRIVTTFDGSLHAPIKYEAVATGAANPATTRLLDYLGSEDAAKLYRKHGFLVR